MSAPSIDLLSSRDGDWSPPAAPAPDPASVPADPAGRRRGIDAVATRDTRVTSADIVEVDATADAADARTVRLAALCVLELLAGSAERR